MDTDDDDAEMGEDLGKGAADEAVHGDHDHREAESDDDQHDDGHGHEDYANDTDADDPAPSMPRNLPPSQATTDSSSSHRYKNPQEDLQ